MATGAVAAALVSTSQPAAEWTVVKPSGRDPDERVSWRGAEWSPELSFSLALCMMQHLALNFGLVILALWSAEGRG